MTDHGMSVTALFTFDEEGRILNFEAERHSSVTGEMERWATPLDQYGEFEGYQLPTHGQGIWHLDDGDFAYIDLELVDVQYEVLPD